MMNKYLRDWDDRKKIYLWTDDKVTVVLSEDELKVTNGFIKIFLFSKSLICFHVEGVWRLHVDVDGEDILFSDIDAVEVNKFGFCVWLKITVNGEILRYIDYEVWDFFSRTIDPTYDNEEEDLVFSTWLKRKVLPMILSNKNEKIMDQIRDNE